MPRPKKAYLSGEYQSITAAAKMYGVAPSTLRDRLHEAKPRAEAHRHEQLLTMEQEKAIIRYIGICDDWGHPVKVTR